MGSARPAHHYSANISWNGETVAVERWKPVVGYESYYEVSDHGRVRSLDRVVEHRNRWGGINRRKQLGKILSPGTHADGHKFVKLSADGSVRGRFVHQLVLEAFVGPRPEGLVCCHWDDDPSNNRLSNLRYDSGSANWRDHIRNKGFKTHCKRGHELSGDNLRLNKPHPNGVSPRRTCRECSAIRWSRWASKNTRVR